MREDMAERFSEPKGRYKKSKFPRRQKKVAKPDEDGQPPNITSMKKVHLAVGDWYSDNGHGADYSILRRFLTSKCGQSWDGVYSEICKRADERSHDGYRLREAVKNVICTNVEINEDGQLYTKDKWGRVRLNFTGWWHEFYVHPETGLLERVPPERSRYRERDHFPSKVFECDGHLYHQHIGIWYRVEMKPVPTQQSSCGGGKWDYSYDSMLTDAFGAHEQPIPKAPYTHRPWYYWDRTDRLKRKYGLSSDGQAWYCFAKQSANKHEIHKLKDKLKGEREEDVDP